MPQFQYDNAILGSSTLLARPDGSGGYTYINYRNVSQGDIFQWNGTRSPMTVNEAAAGAVNFNGDQPSGVAGDNDADVDDYISNNHGKYEPYAQTTTLYGAERSIIYDFKFTVSDGQNSYDIAVLDVDLNDDYAIQTNENGYYLLVLPQPDGTIIYPPAGQWLTATRGIFDNSTYVPHASLQCFAAGTLIDTPNGPLRVEDLRPGDAVTTLDQGAQPLVWTGRRALSAAELAANPNWQPIRIPAGALGAGLPHRDLLVSPQHRVMIASRAVQRLFDRPQVLVAATHLQGVNGIARLDAGAVTYHHIMCRSHQIVLSEGAPTETLYAGKMALAGLPANSRAELLSLFPELADTDPAPMAPARDFLTGRQGRKAAAAHQRKARPLLESWLRG